MSKHFGGMKESKVFDRGVYLDNDGAFKLKLNKTYVKGTRAKGDAFIAEFEVLESSSPKNPVGSTVSYYQGLMNKDVAFGELKLFLYAVLGLDRDKDKAKIASEIDPQVEALMDEAVEKNSLAGATVRCITKPHTTEKKVVVTRHTWQPAT